MLAHDPPGGQSHAQHELKRSHVFYPDRICLFSLVAVAYELWRSQPDGIEILARETRAIQSGSLALNTSQGIWQMIWQTEPDLVPGYLGGAILEPGIYRVQRGSYLYELVELAGGLRIDAASDDINLALAITDNCHIRIPTLAEVADTPVTSDILVTHDPSAVVKININKASVEELDQLPGIGPATARAILDFRTRNGPFKSKEDLMKVPGIKQSRLDAISDLITLS
jgi:competence protein ComEA